MTRINQVRIALWGNNDSSQQITQMITVATGAGTNKTAWIRLHATCGWLNWSPHGQNGHHFADDVFWCIFINKQFCILIKMSLKFVPKAPQIYFGLDNTWRSIGDKQISEPMLTRFADAYMRHLGWWVIGFSPWTLLKGGLIIFRHRINIRTRFPQGCHCGKCAYQATQVYYHNIRHLAWLTVNAHLASWISLGKPYKGKL